VAGVRQKRSRPDEGPPYARYAFFNPYNLSLLAGAATTAAASGHWWIAVCAAATEGLWMLFAPDSAVLQRAFWDGRWAQAKRDELEARQNEKLARLTPEYQMRAAALRDQAIRIRQLAAENPSLTVDLMQSELAKLDALFGEYLDLVTVCGRCERQLQTFDVMAMQRSWQQYSEQTTRFKKGDPRREVAEKNLEVLGQRKTRMDAMQRSVQTARGHMDLMENSFRLLGDQIVNMADTTEFAGRLEDLRVGVEAIRETTDEVQENYDDDAQIEEARNRAAR
jgi:hypothetical protein